MSRAATRALCVVFEDWRERGQVAGTVYSIGSINLDQIGTVSRLPAAGETIIGGAFSTAAGGKGANQSLAARRAGATVHHIGLVGDDNLASEALALLREAGVGLDHVEAVSGRTGVAIILVDDEGENVIAVFSGANAQMNETRVDDGLSDLSQGDLVLLQQEIPVEAVSRALWHARRAGARSVLNTAPVHESMAALAPCADVLIANETEFAQLLGEEASDREAAMLDWTGRHDQSLVVTLGGEGALAASNGAIIRVPAIPIKPVDTVGAGDTFCGYLAAGLARSEELEPALRRAAAAAGLACLKPGAQPAIPPAAEVDAFVKENA